RRAKATEADLHRYATRARRPFPFALSDCKRCALMIAAIKPGKRLSISVQRELLCSSTPRRSLRITPASRSTLKCCDKVDFGISLRLTSRNVEQVNAQLAPTMPA